MYYKVSDLIEIHKIKSKFKRETKLMKKTKTRTLITTLACFGMLLATGIVAASTTSNAKVAKAATDVIFTSCDFTTAVSKNSGYSTAADDVWTYDSNWTVSGGANNNGGWAFAKFGAKNATTENYFVNNSTLAQDVSKIIVTTNAGNLTVGSVNSWGVYVYSDSDCTESVDSVAGDTMTAKTAQTFEFTPSEGVTWSKDYYYKVVFNVTNTTTSTNGVVWIDKADFYYSTDVTVEISSISVSGELTNLQYIGQAWDTTGVTVTAHWTAGPDTDVTDSATLSCDSTAPTAAGSQTVTITATYDTFTDSAVFTADVLDPDATITDTITYSSLSFAGSGYSNFTATMTSGSVYAGNSYVNTSNRIQIRTSGGVEGIVTQIAAGRRVQSITVVYESSAANLTIYGSNDAYTTDDASALYDSSTRGTSLGTITSASTTLTIDDETDYRYIGIRKTASGTTYLTSVTIVYEKYTAATLVADINTMAGGWSNPVATTSCAAHYLAAKSAVLYGISSTELETFKTSIDSDYVSARQTYEYWCTVNGDESPYSGSIVSSSNTLKIASSSDTTTAIIVIAIVTVTATAIGFYFYSKKRKQTDVK